MSRNSLPSCSKGSWGLSVLPRVEGIFTPNTISLSPWSRQRGCCYAIRAGRNLPDKEFRYLRTVIVTAAVYWGFGASLRLAADEFPCPSSTGQASDPIRPLTEFADSCVFSKQSLPPDLCNPSQLRERVSSPTGAHLLPKLRCQFAEFLNQGSLKRLGMLCPPT